MRPSRPVPVICVVVSALLQLRTVAYAAESTRPTPGLTNQKAIATLAVAVVADCFGTRLHHKTIGDWTPQERGGFHPAAAADRTFSSAHDAAVPVWTSDTTGGLQASSRKQSALASGSTFA